MLENYFSVLIISSKLNNFSKKNFFLLILQKLFIKSHQKCKKLSREDEETESANNTQARIIRKLKSQQTDESRKTKRRQIFASQNRIHQKLAEADEDEKCCEEVRQHFFSVFPYFELSFQVIMNQFLTIQLALIFCSHLMMLMLHLESTTNLAIHAPSH